MTPKICYKPKIAAVGVRAQDKHETSASSGHSSCSSEYIPSVMKRTSDVAEIQAGGWVTSDGNPSKRRAPASLFQATTIAPNNWVCEAFEKKKTNATHVFRETMKQMQGASAVVAINCLNRLRQVMQPDSGVYHLAIAACRRDHRFREALELFDEMRADGIQLQKKDFGIAILSASEAGLSELSVGYYEEMIASGMTGNGHDNNMYLGALLDLGRFDDALRFFWGMPHDPSIETRAIACGTMLNACINLEKLDDALECLFIEMPLLGIEPKTLNCNKLLQGLKLKGRINDMMRVVERMPSLDRDRITVNTVLHACIDHDRLDEAMRFFETLLPENEEMHLAGNLVPDDAMCSKLLWACAKTGRTGSVFHILHVMKHPESQDFESAILCHATPGNEARCNDLVQKGIDAGVLKPNLGLDEKTNFMDFHHCTVYDKRIGKYLTPVMKPDFVRFVCETHRQQFTQKTLFFVGRGRGSVRELVWTLLQEAGWAPINHEKDPGLLRVSRRLPPQT